MQVMCGWLVVCDDVVVIVVDFDFECVDFQFYGYDLIVYGDVEIGQCMYGVCNLCFYQIVYLQYFGVDGGQVGVKL